MSDAETKRLKFIGCAIVYREACALAARSRNMVDVEFLPKGLHDLETAEMNARLQAKVDAAGDEYDAIILGYARCNDGTVGLTARQTPIVIPKAHDCISFYFGSRRAYREYFDAHPGTYYRTTGWSERNDGAGDDPSGVMNQLGLSHSFEELVAKYGRDNAEFIAKTMGNWETNYTNMCYVEMGVCDETPFIADARAEADRRGWSFERRDGDWTLLEKLFEARWDDDFIILQPGQRLKPRNDDEVLGVE
jgi:hypothetical protein